MDTGNGNPTNPNYKPKYAILSDKPEKDLERLSPAFAAAAFRRPAAADDVAPYVALAQAELAKGSSFEQALLTAHVAVLSSPDFLYLMEPPGRLDDYALASRLSYLLWSSLPDAELLRVAGTGKLSTPDVSVTAEK